MQDDSYDPYEDDGMESTAPVHDHPETEDLIGRDEDDMIVQVKRSDTPPPRPSVTVMTPPKTQKLEAIESFITDGRRGGPPASLDIDYPEPVIYKPSQLPSAHPTLPQNPVRSGVTQQNSNPVQIAAVLPAPVSSAQPIVSLSPQGELTPNALNLAELHWWTSDEDVRALCESIGTPISLKQIFFSEHKVNGKSKGSIFIEFWSPDHAAIAKSWFENNQFQGKQVNTSLSFSSGGANPFKTLPKEPAHNNSNAGNRVIRPSPSTSTVVPNSRPQQFRNNNVPQNVNRPNIVNPGYQHSPQFQHMQQQQQQQQHHQQPQQYSQQMPGFNQPQPYGQPPMNMNLMNMGMFPGAPGFNPLMPMMPGGMMPMMGMNGGFPPPNSMIQMQQLQQQQNQRNLGNLPAINPLFFNGGNTGAMDDGNRKRTRLEE